LGKKSKATAINKMNIPENIKPNIATAGYDIFPKIEATPDHSPNVQSYSRIPLVLHETCIVNVIKETHE
jgi:hypothetical protein